MKIGSQRLKAKRAKKVIKATPVNKVNKAKKATPVNKVNKAKKAKQAIKVTPVPKARKAQRVKPVNLLMKFGLNLVTQARKRISLLG